MDGKRWCTLLRALKLSDPARYHAVIEEIRAVLDARQLHSSRIRTIDTWHTSIVMLCAMPPVVNDPRAEDGAQPPTPEHLERYWGNTRERIERNLEACDRMLAKLRAARKRRGQ